MKSITILLTITLWVFLAGMAWAQNLKQRMQTRLPTIVDLKTRGVVGENNQGYLAFVQGKKEKQDVVTAENKDRETVYKAIAKKQGTSVKLVGQRRAKQLAGRAKPGEWIQNPDGKWHQK
jgi:uncharacterized protein YdbL (DUF1318 family)